MGVPIKKNTAGQSMAVVLHDTNGDIVLAPTIVAGDFQISIDFAAFQNLATLPVANPAGSGQVEIALSQAETNGDVIGIRAIDQVGAEWLDLYLLILTDTKQIGDLIGPEAACIDFTYTVTDSISGLPVAAVTITVSTDLAGTNVIWSGTTDAFGVARDINNDVPCLQAGTYYFWKFKVGYIDDQNPDAEVVS